MGKTIAEQIVEYRQKNNMTKTKLGQLIGISYKTVYRIEKKIKYPSNIVIEMLKIKGII